MRTAFLYSDQYFAYDYGVEHPLKIERLRLTYDLCNFYGLFDLPHAHLIETEPATESEILRFHTNRYVQVLKQASKGEISSSFLHGLGSEDNPIFPGLWEWSLLHTGASLQCARLVSEGKVNIAFNIAGGLHHAMPGRASGFCYINDPVLAIYHFLDKGKRIMYIDIDAHHADGVQWAFYDNPKVLTISFHQDGRTLFPGSGDVREIGKDQGLGYSINVPMLPGTDDTVFWEGFLAVVPPLIEKFKPDVIVSQLGTDSFLNDPLALLELTTNGFCKVINYLIRHAPAWMALGGGGYDLSNVARAWTLAWAIMNGVDLPADLPDFIVKLTTARRGPERKLRDPIHKSSIQKLCAKYMSQCLEYLEKNVFPLIR